LDGLVAGIGGIGGVVLAGTERIGSLIVRLKVRV